MTNFNYWKNDNNCLLIIDPQNDFCREDGRLSVPNALKDMKVLSKLIDRKGEFFNRIVVTLDSHRNNHIASPICWLDTKTGVKPEPFTVVSLEDVQKDRFVVNTLVATFGRKWALEYLSALALVGKVLVLWPQHCVEGTDGHGICEPLSTSLVNWENNTGMQFERLYKGRDVFTEMYSAFEAEVPVDWDDETALNEEFLHYMDDYANVIWVAGEALSHCVIESIVSMSKVIPLNKIRLISDASSPVSTFEKATQERLDKLIALGLVVQKSDTI
jgi:nicotinamidase-related amidase